MNKEKMFIVRDEDGKEFAYEMLMAKNVDGVPVVWYTDNTKDENGELNVYISSYERTEHSFRLNELTDEELEKYGQIFLNEYNK